ncbi:MAG: YfhO family protein [Anaerolineae bacterium]|nr:YfhO family protein [Anaerolineae bacterium]
MSNRPKHRNIKADLFALLALTAALGVFFAPVLFGGMVLPRGGGDLASFLWPAYRFSARELHAGRLPLWNPHLHGGRPFIADNQSAFFYPPNLLLFLLAPDIPYAALEALVIFHFWLAGVGMYVCLRVVLAAGAQGNRRAALFGALSFMLSDVFVTHQGNLNLIAVAAYLPWVFLCTWQAVSAQHAAPLRGRVRWALGAGALFGVATLAGHAQMSLFLALTIGAVGLHGLVTARQAARVKAVLLAALVGLVGVGLAAAALLPALELTPHSLRASISYAEATRFSLPPQALVGLAMPWVYGRGPDHFTGDWDRVEVGYAGALALLAALYGAWRARKQPLARFLVMFGALALLMALGEYTPLYRLAHELPLLNSLRAPARFVLLFDFALAGLAALGVQALLVTTEHTENTENTERRLKSLRVLRVLCGEILILLLAAELIANGAGIEVDADSPYAGYDHPALLAWLHAQEGVFRIEGAAGAWQPDAAAFYGVGLYDIYGLHNPLALSSYETFYWSAGQRGTPVWDFLGARYVVRPQGDPPAGAPFADDFALVFEDGGGLAVYENRRAQPLARVVPRAVSTAQPMEAWDAIHAPNWDPGTVVYVEDGPASAGGVGGHVEPVAYEPGRLVYAVEVSGPAYLVLSEVYYPGWRAMIDGEPAPIYRANTAFRALYIDAPGAHTVELVFAPPSFYLGAAVSLGALTGLLAGFVLTKNRVGDTNEPAD